MDPLTAEWGKDQAMHNQRPSDSGWTEANSSAFVDLADIFVPAREEQLATICDLIPAGPDEAFTVVELGAGNGALAAAVLQAFPRCSYHALDRSEVMRARLHEVLAAYSGRAHVGDFDLTEQHWRTTLPTPLRAILSSLVVHHLPGDEKRKLFADLAPKLDPGGALILADLVAPPSDRVRNLFARQWDAAVRSRSLARTGELKAWQRFRDDGWNYYADDDPDPMDQPSPLLDQLLWMRAAGFTTVGCFWMSAGHAIYGGYV